MSHVGERPENKQKSVTHYCTSIVLEQDKTLEETFLFHFPIKKYMSLKQLILENKMSHVGKRSENKQNSEVLFEWPINGIPNEKYFLRITGTK